jgi:protein ImuB
MVVSGRGLLTAPIDRLSVDGGPWEQVVAWAGPWPVTERWWSIRRRTARLQLVTADGVARLLRTERGQWWVEALYD